MMSEQNQDHKIPLYMAVGRLLNAYGESAAQAVASPSMRQQVAPEVIEWFSGEEPSAAVVSICVTMIEAYQKGSLHSQDLSALHQIVLDLEQRHVAQSARTVGLYEAVLELLEAQNCGVSLKAAVAELQTKNQVDVEFLKAYGHS